MSNTEEKITSALLKFFRSEAYEKPANYNAKDPRYYEFQLEEKAVAVEGLIYGLVLRVKLTFNPVSKESLYPMFDAIFSIAPYAAPVNDIQRKEWGGLLDDNSLLNRQEVQEKIVVAQKNGSSGILAGIAACPDWLNAMAEIDPNIRNLVRLALASDASPNSKSFPPAL